MFLQQRGGYTVVAEVGQVGKLLRETESECPDLIFMDWNLPSRSNLVFPANEQGDDAKSNAKFRAVVLSTLHRCCPWVVVFSQDSGDCESAKKAGADVFINKSDPPDALISFLEELESKD